MQRPVRPISLIRLLNDRFAAAFASPAFRAHLDDGSIGGLVAGRDGRIVANEAQGMTTGDPGDRFWMETDAGLIVAVKAHPGARRLKIGPVIAAAQAPGWPDARLKISVPAAPEGGQANGAIRRALADWLGIREARIAQQAGMAARDKKFLVADGRAADFARQFATS
jgi:uncharacterized protein